jgi:misacylated tRNA(Ala) deacylase
MQQHTGQHLLSAVMRRFSADLETLGWGMGVEGSMNYVDLPRKPSQDELERIQELCAQEIRENRKIWLETPDDVKHNSLPEDYDKAEGVVRVIRIGDIDANT